jgi:hypothetical protein
MNLVLSKDAFAIKNGGGADEDAALICQMNTLMSKEAVQ